MPRRRGHAGTTLGGAPPARRLRKQCDAPESKTRDPGCARCGMGHGGRVAEGKGGVQTPKACRPCCCPPVRSTRIINWQRNAVPIQLAQLGTQGKAARPARRSIAYRCCHWFQHEQHKVISEEIWFLPSTARGRHKRASGPVSEARGRGRAERGGSGGSAGLKAGITEHSMRMSVEISVRTGPGAVMA